MAKDFERCGKVANFHQIWSRCIPLVLMCNQIPAFFSERFVLNVARKRIFPFTTLSVREMAAAAAVSVPKNILQCYVAASKSRRCEL